MFKQRKTVANMRSLKEMYAAKKTAEPISTHRTLVRRALPLLYKNVPKAEELFEPLRDIFDSNVTAPDRSGDREKGTGRHYYNATSFLGAPKKTVAGYYKNGRSRFSKSARTMLEEDYTMAVTLHKAGFPEKAAEYLARAIHMVSDMTCLPHATKMTYLTPKGSVHSAYESLAGELYPDAVPEQELTRADLLIFENRRDFSVTNKLVEAQIGEPKELETTPVESITKRLYTSEKVVAALLFRFYEDVSMPAEKCFCLADGMKLTPHGKLPRLIVKVTEEGLHFLPDKDCPKNEFYELMCGKTFRAAHRKNGVFTLSPVDDDPNGRCVVAGTTKLVDFDPRRADLCFALGK